LRLRFNTGPKVSGMMALTLRRFAPAALWIDEWRRSRFVVPEADRPLPRRPESAAAEIPLQAHKLFDAAECKAIGETVLALKAHWTERPGVKYRTLGAAAYLDAAAGHADYAARAKVANPLLADRFAGPLERVREFFAAFFREDVFYDPSCALPGFHIFSMADHDASRDNVADRAHFDLQWMHAMPGRAPPRRTLSFTLPIQHPAAGASLAFWPMRREQLALTGVAPRDYAASHPCRIVKYRRGHVVVHDGDILHAIGPVPRSAPRGYRITLQGHGVRTPRGWMLYW
jgi:hypothetical protein